MTDGLKLSLWNGVARVAVGTGVSDLVSPPGNAVLMYHSIGGPYGNPDGTFPTERLATDLRRLATRFEFVDLPAVLEPSRKPRLSVTFDDGYADVVTRALPILEDLGIPATVFVIADVVGENRTDPRKYGLETTRDQMLSAEQMQTLVDHDLITIGNHTITHPSLPDIDDRRLEREIVGARDMLRERHGVDVDRFCYPGGKYDERSRQLVAQSHQLGVGVDRGFIHPPVSAAHRRATIPRFNAARPAPTLYWETSGTGAIARSAYRRVAGRFGDQR